MAYRFKCLTCHIDVCRQYSVGIVVGIGLIHKRRQPLQLQHVADFIELLVIDEGV